MISIPVLVLGAVFATIWTPAIVALDKDDGDGL